MPGRGLYFYPMSARGTKGEGNPYGKNLVNALSDHFRVVNRKDPSDSGILNLIKYLNKTEILFLNWIEDLPDKKFGYIQSILFMLMLRYLRYKKATICWVLHNKFSHYRKNRMMKSVIFRLLAARSTHIITHSEEGLHYIQQFDKRHVHNIIFLHHPVTARVLPEPGPKQYDIIIWGTLLEYKGVDKFLEYLHALGLQEKYHILVTGKIPSEEYRKKLYRLASAKIRIENRFVSDEELFSLISSSKVVLFTYKQESVLSSGALMDSISAGATVIGPETGAFGDLAKEGLVITYTDFRDLITKTDLILGKKLGVNKAKLDTFIAENSWPHFGIRLADFIQPRLN